MKMAEWNSRKKVPTVSVVIPTYNRAHLVSRAIHSVLTQTFQDWELFVVDDGSTDNAAEIVRSFHDPRIHYLRHEINRGASAARNTGIRASHGQYIAFLDSDDEWLPAKLDKQLACFRNSPGSIGLVGTGCGIIDDDGIIRYQLPSQRGFIHKDLLLLSSGFIVTTGTLLFRHDVFLSIGGFDEELTAFQDYDICIRASDTCLVDYIPEPLLLIHDSDRWERIRRSPHKITSGVDILIKKYFSGLGCDIHALAQWLNYAGNYCFTNGDLRVGRSYYFRSLKIFPFQLRILLHIMLSSHPQLHKIFFSFWRRLYWNFLKRRKLLTDPDMKI